MPAPVSTNMTSELRSSRASSRSRICRCSGSRSAMPATPDAPGTSMNPPGPGTMMSRRVARPSSTCSIVRRGVMLHSTSALESQVRIEQHDAPAGLRHGCGHVHRDVALADPALARGDGDRLRTADGGLVLTGQPGPEGRFRLRAAEPAGDQIVTDDRTEPCGLITHETPPALSTSSASRDGRAVSMWSGTSCPVVRKLSLRPMRCVTSTSMP